jgi:group I intron endonuclease
MIKEKRYNYSYITTNLLNGKQYVGDHSTDNLNDGYLGSGTYLQKAIRKYGKENFKREILEQFNTKQEAFEAQEKWINEYNTLSPKGYNLSPTGGIGVTNCFSPKSLQKMSESRKGKRHSKETKEKMSISQTGRTFSPKSLQKMSESRKGKSPWNKGIPRTDETKRKISQTEKGKKMSEESKKKISKAMSGINNPMWGIEKSEETKEKIRTTLLGRKISEETREKHKRRDKCKYCGFETNISNLNRYHNDNCKNKNVI